MNKIFKITYEEKDFIEKKINHNGSAASTRPPHYGCDIFT